MVTLPLILPGVVIAVCGVCLAMIGLYPRRRGDTPHCARCEYNLTGNESRVCPECGTPLGAMCIVFGERHRRRGLGATGIALALVGFVFSMAVSSPSFRRIEWIHHRPVGWLIDDLSSGDTNRDNRAWVELQRRLDTGELAEASQRRWIAASLGQLSSPNLGVWQRAWSFLERRDAAGGITDEERQRWAAAALDLVKFGTAPRTLPAWQTIQTWDARGTLPTAMATQIIELALARQTTRDDHPCDNEMMEFLGKAATAGRLDEKQAERFFSQGVLPRLRVRPTVVLGDELPYQLVRGGRGPNRGWSHKLAMVSAKLGPNNRDYGGSSSGSGLSAGGLGSWMQTTGLPPGKHVFELTIEAAAIEGDKVGVEGAKPRWSRRLTLSAETEVLAAAPPAYVRCTRDESLLPAVQRAVTWPQYARWPEDVMINVNNAPANLAFEVLARVDGKEHPIGSLSIVKGASCTFGMSHSAIQPINPGRIDIILRSSETVARRSVDLFDIWAGEIVIENVPTAKKGR